MRQLQNARVPGITYRSQTPNSIAVLEIVSDAVRAAALAPTDRAALDVTGEALRRVPKLARTEASHA